VPERRAGRERPAIDIGLEVGVAKPVGGGPVDDLAEPQAPAGAVVDRRRRDDRQRGRAALAMQDPAAREPVLRSIGQDLDPDQAAKAVDAADAPDDQTGGLAQLGLLRRSRA
jgi:hypothetical protein